VTLCDERLQLFPRRLTRGLVANHHLHLSTAEARRDLELLEACDALLCPVQGDRNLRLGNAEEPQHLLPVGGRSFDRRAEGIGGHRLLPHRV